MERIMALDLGKNRIGVALSDPFGSFAQPHAVWKTKENWIQKLKEFIKEKSIIEIVVGYPISMSGKENEQTQWVTEQIDFLKETFQNEIKISKSDERLSSKEGETLLIAAGMRREKRKTKIDAIAAALILDSFLQKRNSIVP